MNRELESLELPPEVRAMDRALEAGASAATAPGGADALSAEFKRRLRTRIAAAEAAGDAGAEMPTAPPAPARRARPLVLWAVAAAALAMVGAGGFWFAASPGPVGYVDYKDGVALAEPESLPAKAPFAGGEFGSAIHLDDNRIALTVAPGAVGRVLAANRVSLDSGRVWFDVVPNSGDFTVTTPSGTVSVVGTSFGVQVSGDGAMEVAVSRGKVRVECGENRILLDAGKSVAVSLRSGIGPTVAVTSAPAWVEELLQRETQSRLRLLYPSAVPVPDTERTLKEGGGR